MQPFNIELLKQVKEHYANEEFNIVGFFGLYARGEVTNMFKVLDSSQESMISS